MPVIIKPSPELAGCFVPSLVTSPEEILRYTNAKHWGGTLLGRPVRPPQVRQTSFKPPLAVSPLRNGFVRTMVRAFEEDLHLILRPDDVWLAIMIQFSVYVNNNAEELRHLFVSHEGKKALEFFTGNEPIWSMDMGYCAQQMTNLIQENVVDPDLREWLLPNFTTTTDIDKSVAAIVMMDTTQAYFEFSLAGGCGFPSVTLLGEKDDWNRILEKVRQLPKYGKPTEDWSKLLVPVIEHMIASFELPEAQFVKHFWLSAVHSAGKDGSGTSVKTLSGWLTAFCYFCKKTQNFGTIISDETMVTAYSDDKLADMTKYDGVTVDDRKRLILSGVAYPIIRLRSIPEALCEVPVIVKDLIRNLKHDTLMIAGSVGFTVKRSNMCGGDRRAFDTVQPCSGWWMVEKGDPSPL